MHTDIWAPIAQIPGPNQRAPGLGRRPVRHTRPRTSSARASRTLVPRPTQEVQLTTIRCQHCGREEQTSPRWARAQKYCKLCQVARDLTIRPPSARNCTICGRRFWPIRSHKSWNRCGSCAVFVKNPRDYEPCNGCGTRRPPAAGLARTCVGCVQQSPDARAAYLEKIQQEINANIERQAT